MASFPCWLFAFLDEDRASPGASWAHARPRCGASMRETLKPVHLTSPPGDAGLFSLPPHRALSELGLLDAAQPLRPAGGAVVYSKLALDRPICTEPRNLNISEPVAMVSR